MDKGKVIQVDIYPDGRIVYIYDDGKTKQDIKENKNMTSKQALQKRLEEYKFKKASEEIMNEYNEAYKELSKEKEGK